MFISLKTEIVKRIPNEVKTRITIVENKSFIKTGEGKEPPFISKLILE